MFINISNHSSSNWSQEQTISSERYGRIFDLPFPSITTSATDEDITKLIEEYLKRINELVASDGGICTSAIMLQGEFVFTFRMVTALKENGYKVVASVSNRNTIEEQLPDGRTKKTSEYVFAGFREY